MKVVVDTNIVFSALLNPSGTIGELIVNPIEGIELYSSSFMRVELFKHHKKISKISGLTIEEIEGLTYLITENIHFISEDQIPEEIWKESEIILSQIDTKDTPFVASAKYLDSKLWTGDKKLIKGINTTEFIACMSTTDMLLLRKEK